MSDTAPTAKTAPTDDALAATPGLEAGLADVLIAVLTTICSLVTLWCGMGVNLALAGLLHAGVVGLPAVFLADRRRQGGDVTMPALLLVATFAGGPIGAAGAACAALALWHRRPSPLRLAGWYAYIAGVVERGRLTDIHEELTARRRPPDPAASVPRYAPILTGTSLVDQQRVLGMIGRRYHDDFRPVLRRALRNRNGLIRTQAAAIASGLGLEEKNRLWASEAVAVSVSSPSIREQP